MARQVGVDCPPPGFCSQKITKVQIPSGHNYFPGKSKIKKVPKNTQPFNKKYPKIVGDSQNVPLPQIFSSYFLKFQTDLPIFTNNSELFPVLLC